MQRAKTVHPAGCKVTPTYINCIERSRFRRSARAVPRCRRAQTSIAAVQSSDFIREHLKELAAYTPIEPFEVLSQKLGRAPEDIIKLDANENPYGPPPEVMAALGAMQFSNIYPDAECRRLREALASFAGVGMEHILVGCGADELIDLIMRCVLEPGDCIINCPPTFGMYAFDAAVNNARVIDVPRLEGFAVDVPGIVAAAAEHGPKMIFLTSPNNPDGSMLNEEDLLRVLEIPGALVVLDEAYIEFSGHESHCSWVAERENLVVLRTFSKLAGLAGLRVGYGAFPLGLIEYVWRAKQPYNVSVAAETAACAALTNLPYLTEVKDKLVNERANLFAVLDEQPYLEPYKSNANFILCRVVGRDAAELKDELAKQGIMVRYYSKPVSLSGCVRISVGTPEQTLAIKEVLVNL